MATSRRVASSSFSRSATARTSSRAASTGASGSSGYRGAEGRRKIAEEEERAAARREQSAMMAHMPFRYFRPANSEPGQYIIVDHEPDFVRHEHNLMDPRTGRWSIFSSCIADHATCPVCKSAERPAYFALYLTIIDLTPYEDKDGNTIEWSKKLLVVKPALQKKFLRLFERQGTLRGALMEATRDGEKDASIGNEQEFIEFVPEEELAQYETTYTDKQGKEHDVIGHEVFDYDGLFPAQTEQMLRALVGGKPEPGSRDDDDRALGRDSRERRPSSSRGSGDDWDERGKGPRREAPTRPARRAADREEEPEGDAEGEDGVDEREERRPVRSAAPRATSAARTASAPGNRPRPGAARTARPAREEEVEDDDAPQRGRRTVDDDEEAPDRSATSLAERRRALRRA